jgi:hypothetical protein
MEVYLFFSCMLSWNGQGKLGLFFFITFVRISGKKVRWMVRSMGSKLLKGRGRDCNRVLFRTSFVGTEKNHENIGIAGELVEFRPIYKFKALPLRQSATTELMSFCTWYTANKTHGNFAP